VICKKCGGGMYKHTRNDKVVVWKCMYCPQEKPYA